LSKKILITGACGFFGSHLTEFFINKGYSVVAFDRYNPTNNLGWLESSKYKNDIQFILGDIRDYDSVNKAIQGSSICIHLAALIGIPYSYVSPLAYVKTNVEGTYNVLEASKNSNLDQIIITSTSETYGSSQYSPMDELHPLNAQSPYAASKVAADQLTLSYYRSFDLPIKIARPFNIYGPRQSLRAVIPSIILQCLKDINPIKLGNVESNRDFTYVSDTCESIESILNCSELFGEVVNIGNGNLISIKDLADLIFKKLEKSTSFSIDKNRLRPEKSEVTSLLASTKKIYSKTNWQPKINISEGIDETINWMKENINTYNSINYTV
tara:strand:- start:1725 stop:2702 length:978 start_codon:yes stop_codon:yes gene_type:complete